MGFLFFRSSKIKQHEFFEIEKEEKNEKLGLKIHICGNNAFRKKVIDELFSSTKITDKHYSSRAKREFKTDQFYWIAQTYQNISKEIIDNIMKEIQDDRDRIKPPIIQQVILCFFSEDNENLLSLFDEIEEGVYTPLFVIVSENPINKFAKVDCRRITNIICKGMKNETLNSRIISSLWECDCYYNEKGNKICRYTPDNIFKSLEIDLSFYSINILLTGKSRAGKSTFINYLSNKLTALECNAKDSVTQYLTEYYLYINNNNNKMENTAIKLIDTPGIVPNNINKSICFLEQLLNNKDNNMDKQIHFILFFFMEGDSLEGIEDIFDLLNRCNIPVLIIINKALNDEDNGKTKDIKSTISYLLRNNFNNLTDKENFIGVNLVKTGRIESFGVEDIFKRIYTLYKQDNKFNDKIKHKIKQFIVNYHGDIMKEIDNEEPDDKLIKKINELKKELDQEIHMFKLLNVDSIIESGKKPAIKCKNVINSLNNISQNLKNFEYDIPMISFFQAFMVKEIGEIFGYDTKEMNYGLRSYLTQINKIFAKGNYTLEEDEKKELNRTININMNIIENQIKSEFQKSNKEFILNLANLFKTIKEKYNKEGLELSDEAINKRLTNEICFTCMGYLELQLKRTNGLIFFDHYLNICEKLLYDLKKYSQMSADDWGKKQIKVIKE